VPAHKVYYISFVHFYHARRVLGSIVERHALFVFCNNCARTHAQPLTHMVLITSDFLKLATGEFDLRTIYNLIASSKNIDRLQGLDGLENLRWADFSKNNLVRIENLNSNLGNLQFLDLSFNKIQKACGLESLVKLETLKLNGNPIALLVDIEGIRHLPALTHLTLQKVDETDRCPVCAVEGYKERVYDLVPHLLSLDSKRKHLLDEKIDDSADNNLSLEIPKWDLDISSIEDILNPELVADRLDPLLAEFERKAEECRLRLKEGDKYLESVV